MVDLVLGHGQRTQGLDHLVVGAGGFDHQLALERGLGDFLGHFAVTADQALHHAAAVQVEPVIVVAGRDIAEPVGDQVTLLLHFLGEGIVAPEVFQRLGGGGEGQVVAAEGAVVLTGFPLVQLRLQQHHRQGQAIAAQRLGQGDDVRLDADIVEAEEGAGTTAAGLDVVQDQQHVVLAADALQVAQPVEAGRVDAALALYGFHDHGGRMVHAA